MPITNDFILLAPSAITILRDERQRRKIDTSGLVESIAKHGVLNPIIIDRSGTLIAGERRLTASIELDLPTIPCRYIEDLSGPEAQIIELEENLRRADLPWQDEVRAVAKLHDLYIAANPEWTAADTSEALGIDKASGNIYMLLRVAREIENPRIAGAGGWRPAYNILSRVDERKTSDALSDILENAAAMFDPIVDTSVDMDDGGGLAPTPARAFSFANENSIIQADFLEWAPSYSGPPFNFLHCDFPYGINVFSGKLSGRDRHAATYDDSPDVYWTLIRCLCANLDRLMAHSAHIMFWFSMEHYDATLDCFRSHAPAIIFNKFPLVWVKSDNVGIIPDPTRGPRRVYETALIGAREDRLILKPVANAHASPTDKSIHHSAKPEPMLKHFFQMFVDDNTRLLDPTCGSGAALRAAESHGAKLVLGLERDPEHAKAAQSALRSFRALRRVAR